jgi:hypothetical protein
VVIYEEGKGLKESWILFLAPFENESHERRFPRAVSLYEEERKPLKVGWRGSFQCKALIFFVWVSVPEI